MSQENTVKEVVSSAVNEVGSDNDPNNLSLESLALLINTERLKYLENKIASEFVELKKRQDQITFLHKLIKTINVATDNDELEFSKNQEFKDLLSKAKEYGVEIDDKKFKYSKDERDRLIENIRMTADDLNVLNDMQLQTITRLTNERYESYQLARSIMKPLHDAKTNTSRAIHR